MNTPQDSFTGQQTGGPTSAGSNGLNAQGGQMGSSSGTEQSQQARQQASELADTVKTQGKAKVEEYRSVAARKVDKLADSVKAAASEMEGDEDIGQLSQYMTDAAQKINTFSESLRTKSGDELVRDVTRMAREHPAVFIGGSIAIGFGLARFARAAQPPRSHSADASEHLSPYGQTYGQSTGSLGSSGTATAGFGSEFNEGSSASSPGSTGAGATGSGSSQGYAAQSGAGISGGTGPGSAGLAGTSSTSSPGVSGGGSTGTAPLNTRDLSSNSDSVQGRKPS